MLPSLYLKELKRNLGSVSFYVFAAILAFGAYLFASNLNPDSYIMGLSVGKEWHNAPILIAKLTARFSVVGVLFTMFMVGRVVTRDFAANVHDFFFTVPMSKLSYLGGRFLGGLSANALIYAGIVIGFILGCLVIGPKYYGPFQLSSFLLPAAVILVPNLLLIGSIFFSLATLSRKMVMTYLAGVAFLMVYGLIQGGFTFWENDTAKALLDPFGISALGILTKYWTVSDMNLRQIPLDSTLIWNRVIWMTVSLAILLYTWRRFQFVSVLDKRKGKRMVTDQAESAGIYELGRVLPAPIDHTLRFQLKKCLHLVLRELNRIVLHPAFLILTLMAMGEVVLNFAWNTGPTGETVYPLTSRFLDQTMHIWIYMIPLTIFFSGMIIWRERDHLSNEFYDTLPNPDWMSYLSKLLAMMSIQFLYLILAILTGITTQVIGFGYTDIELGLYFKWMFGITLLKFWFLTIVVFFIHNLTWNKMVGFFICAVLAIADLVIFEGLGAENFLLRYGQLPPFLYSDVNGFGHFGPLIIWYTIYWLFLAVFLGVSTSLLWRRNNETSLRFRFRVGMRKVSGRIGFTLASLAVLFLATGSFIAYNKYILNQYLSEDELKELRADYEKHYAQYEDIPQPRVVRADLRVDIYPEKRKALLRGSYTLRNKTDLQIHQVVVNLSDRRITDIRNLSFSQPTTLTAQGRAFGFRIYELQEALDPGSEIKLEFDLVSEAKGFTENNPKNELARNGTCILLSADSPDYFPVIGYISSLELSTRKDREEFELPEQPKSPRLEDADRSVCMLRSELMEYEAVVSTCSSQTVVSNGNLIRQWSEDHRNYYHFKSDGLMANEFVFASADYTVLRDQYETIEIEVYYDGKYPENAERMISGVRRSFDYCTKNFCPFPYRFIRIAEIPRYVHFGARSQPTVFTWREDAGFISNYEDPQDIDMVFGICTHEMAHQWWAYIVTPADAEGAETLTEAIAMYVQTMCLEKEYGKEVSRKFLKKRMDRYLSRRKKDVAGERPLMRGYADQYYLNYPKSCVVMYALQNYIGEDRVNTALRNVVNEYGHRVDLFPLSLDIVNAFKAVAPDSLQYIISDLFENITLWENEARSASSVRLDDGRYMVTLEVASRKFRADSIGNQTEIPIEDYIEIGVLGENDDELYLKKHRFTGSESRVDIIVDKRPLYAGIDPFSILIDRDRDNNRVEVEDR